MRAADGGAGGVDGFGAYLATRYAAATARHYAYLVERYVSAVGGEAVAGDDAHLRTGFHGVLGDVVEHVVDVGVVFLGELDLASGRVEGTADAAVGVE